jgi:hypothetical protein
MGEAGSGVARSPSASAMNRCTISMAVTHTPVRSAQASMGRKEHRRSAGRDWFRPSIRGRLRQLKPVRCAGAASPKGWLRLHLYCLRGALLCCGAEENKTMLSTVKAVVREGKIELLERIDLPEGSKVLVTVLPDAEASFWLDASQTSLDRIWDNPEDDVYADLLDA